MLKRIFFIYCICLSSTIFCAETENKKAEESTGDVVNIYQKEEIETLINALKDDYSKLKEIESKKVDEDVKNKIAELEKKLFENFNQLRTRVDSELKNFEDELAEIKNKINSSNVEDLDDDSSADAFSYLSWFRNCCRRKEVKDL